MAYTKGTGPLAGAMPAMSRSHTLCCLASAIAILTCTAARAQEAADTAAADADSGGVLQHIVVTAQKREQSLQDIPLAVSAFSSEDLQRSGITRLDALDQAVPNLQLSSVYGTTRPSIFMRGIGLDGFNAIDGNSVSLSQDEVIIESRAGQLAQMYDLARVEVLRGPQGTLYGRNTTGGAINLFSKLPGDALEGEIDVGVGRFNHREATAGVSVPLMPGTLGVRLSGQYVESDGDIRNAFTGKRVEGDDRRAGRMIVLWTPTDTQRWVLNVNAARSDTDGGTFFQIGARPDGSDFLGYRQSPGFYTLSNDAPTFEKLEMSAISLKGEITLPFATLTSVSGYNDVESGLLEDSDASPAALLTVRGVDDARQFSQELRLSSLVGGAFDWIAGVYYFDQDTQGSNDLRLDLSLLDPSAQPLAVLQAYRQNSRSYAAFGQVDVPVGERCTLTGGLRWTKDEREFDQDVFIDGPLAFSVGDDRSYDQFTWRAGIEWQLADEQMLYLTYNRGYRAGQPAGLALASASEFGFVAPEKVDTVELGYKSRWLDDRLQVNAALFNNDFANLQVIDFAPAGGLNTLFLRNAEAYTRGAELETVFVPAHGWRLTASFAYLDSEYQSLSVSDKLTGTLQPVDGQPLVNAPEVSFNVMAEYTLETSIGSWSPHVEYAHTTRQNLKVSTEERLFQQPGYGLFNASLTYGSPDLRWQVSLWGRNLGGEQYVTELIDVRDLGFIESRHGERRSYGANLRYRF